MISRRASLLELLHPDGITKRCVAVGSNRLSLHLPECHTLAGESADLILLAPTAAECRIDGWLEEAVQLLSRNLTADGLAYVLAPPRWRPRIKRMLHQHGLLIEASIVHLPSLASSRYLVPLDPVHCQYVLSKLTTSRSWKRRLATIAFRLPGADGFVGSVFRSVGFAARPPGARPLFDWLFQLDGDTHETRSVVISMGRQEQEGAVTLHRFTGRDARPSAIAKITLKAPETVDRISEAAILSRLGPSAKKAGAEIPQLLASGQIDDHPVFLQTVVDGQCVATLLNAKPDRLLDLMERLVCWLENWNRCTAVRHPLDQVLLDRELLAPADLLTPFLKQGEEYQKWLTRRCTKALGVPVPLVATHNDLTMANVLLDDQGHIGIIDWEMGETGGLPLVDFFYAIADSVAATRNYADRPEAFEECFAQGGRWASVVTRFQERLSNVVQVPLEIADLCFHACWLHHAANEHRSAKPSGPRPFLKIVQWLALHRSGTKG